MLSSLLVLLITVCFAANAFAADREFYAIQIYNLETTAQEQQVDTYLENDYLPALHRMGFKNIGVFKPIANDTSSNKLIVIFIPLEILDQ